MHALQHRLDTRIIFPPEIVRDCNTSISLREFDMATTQLLHEQATEGSELAPGMVGQSSKSLW